MLPKGYLIFLLLAVGLYIRNANGQAALQTKCQHGWSQEYGRCYLVVNYAYTYTKALGYCQQYGAKLALPTGYVISTALTDLVTQQISGPTQYFIGYSYPSAQADLATGARGSDDAPTMVDVGLWGRREPDISAGLCARVDTTSGLWSLGDCDDLLPFVCEIDPCPTGSRDTIQCNGRCIGQARACDMVDDCGNNLDEQDCRQPDGICTYTFYENSGTLRWPETGNSYRANQNCSWTIVSAPGSRMAVSFTSFNTEDNADFVEVYDGSNHLLDADLILRLSGTTTRSLMTSLNFLIVRFVSDSQDNKSGFEMEWTTDHDCSVFEVLPGYTFGNSEAQYDSVPLGSLVTELKCQTDCYADNDCFGFSYEQGSRTCRFINKFPILSMESGFDLHVTMCPKGTTVQGSVFAFAGQLTATQAAQQLTTPLYPSTYPGNYVQEYAISAPANNLITLQVVAVDLCYGDYVYIYGESRELLARLGWDSVLGTIVSTGNQVAVRMELERHGKCRGVMIEYKQGCDLVFSEDGVATSPGYGVAGISYPPLMLCSWRINAPAADRSVTVQFDDFQLGARDSLTVGYADGRQEEYSGQELLGQSITTTNHVTLIMATSSRPSGRGWSASFSPGCTSLSSSSYMLDHEGSNYGDIVEIRCADGYYFSGTYQGRSRAIVTCQRGGTWDNELPICARGFCGPAQSIANGRVDIATGVSGGDTASYACNTGFNLVNSADTLCLADNTWGTLPYCTAPQCVSINSNAWVRYPVGDGRSQGSVANLTCPDTDTELYGPAIVQCDSGAWDWVSGVSSCEAKRCGVPLIANALFTPGLSQGQYYTEGQLINVQCQEGYDLVGESLVQCGSETLPSCNVRTCTLDGIDDLAMSGTYNFGQVVTVSCQAGFELVASTATTMRVNCQANGAWDNTPACQRKSCGAPYQVGGSTYTYIGNTCYDHGCSFRLACRHKYELFGASTRGDDTVRCDAGIWDFGDLVCIGGQCDDPTYVPSSILVGDSFQELDSITYVCTRDGYTPVNADGSQFTFITCRYNPVTQSMEWDGPLPECRDTTLPTIVNCPGSSVALDSVLTPPNFPTPYPDDNNAVKTFTKEPPGIKPNQKQPFGEIWTYTATDYADNTEYCIVRIRIPRTLECLNSMSTSLQLTNFAIQQEFVTMAYINVYEDFPGEITITPDKARLTVMPNSSLLNYVEEVNMRAYRGDDLVEECILQFRFSPLDCATWQLNTPDTTTITCSGNTCTLRCRSGYFFVDDPSMGEVIMRCSQGQWDRTPPTCALGLTTFTQYSGAYSFGYTINSGISDFLVCEDEYTPQVTSNLDQFAAAMQSQCNSVYLPNGGNAFQVTLQDAFTMSFITTTPATATVRFNYFLSMTDLSASNSQSLLESCASLINNKLNTGVDINPLSVIAGNTAAGCGQGLFKVVGSQVTLQNVCEGDRKYFSDQGTRRCLECPIGKRYDSDANECSGCTDGYYGVAGGCERCPNLATPGITGSTTVNDCYLKDICPKGYYSETGLAPCTRCPQYFYNHQVAARTCQACATDQITDGDAKESSSDCLTMAQAVNGFVATPCDSDPCFNGGVCSILQHDFFCTCPPDATGEQCETELTACSSNPCENGQRCFSDDLNSFTCECNLNPSQVEELSGDLCEIDRFGCGGEICLNNGTCHNQLQNFRCKCPTHGGYKNLGTCDTPINQCVDDPCSNGAACVAHGSYYRSCDCQPGYEGLNCTENTDDCSPNPCLNGAECTDALNSFSCACLQGYHGNRCQFRKACERECSGGITTNCHRCSMANTDSCSNVGNSFTCNCAPGYTGVSCDVLISPCHSYPCQAGGECVHLSAAQYRCECRAPWTGDRCHTQMDNCPAGTGQCHNGGTCYSSPDGYVCQCPPNYIGEDCAQFYDKCARLNPCLAGGLCSLDQDGTILCDCPQGYDGDYCEMVLPTCSTTTPCANGGTCTDTSSGVSCQCVAGYTGARCQVNIDECAAGDSCSAVQECVDGINQYTCICAPGRWGDSCDKEVGVNFDYIIPARAMGRGEASSFMFGDGETPISALTVSFWLRYTGVMGDGISLNVYGSNTGDDLIPENPDFMLTFDRTGVFSYVKDDSRRKKRADGSLNYNQLGSRVDVADGYWHHLVVAWSEDSGEIDLYVDNEFRDQIIFAQGQTLGTSGFVVFGDYDVVSGTTDPSNSFSGRVSQLFILDHKVDRDTINRLYTRTTSPSNLLIHERTLMLHYPVFYNSELAADICLPGSDCPALSPGATVPGVTSCPADTLVYTTRGGRPIWSVPTFSGAVGAPFYNYENNSTMDWGVYGVAYAAYDAVGSAAVCVFTLFNYQGQALPCNIVQGSNAPSSVNTAGGRRYSPQCTGGEAIAGQVPVYQSCTMYSMWGQQIRTNYQYQYPVCAATGPLTAQTSLSLELQVTGWAASTCNDYKAYVTTMLTDLNNDVGGKLCAADCDGPVTAAISCTGPWGDTARVDLDLGLVETSLSYQGNPITIEEVLRLAVGDREVFTYTDNGAGVMASPMLSSVDITSDVWCADGYEAQDDKCVECGAGTYYADGMCHRCGFGDYRDPITSTDYTKCDSCHPSRTTVSDGSTSDIYCKEKCIPGKFNDITFNRCVDCPVGYYVNYVGSFICNPCNFTTTTAEAGANAPGLCIDPPRPTDPPGRPIVGAATEDTGLNVGIIVAVVLSILIIITIVLLIVCFCCCRDILPCFAKKQTVAPTGKDGYYANKYGAHNMQFVSYNLRDVREKKGRPLDRQPIVENHPLSDETGSVKTDISVHVPVFQEKLDGKVTRKSLYISNGGQNLNASRTSRSMMSTHETPRTYEQPITSSPRGLHYDEVEEGIEADRKQRSKRRRRRHRKEPSGERSHRSAERTHRHTREPAERSYSEERPENHYDEIPMSGTQGVMPKALAPMPHRIKSMPPSDIHIRPLSPLSRPRAQVEPNEYQDFLVASPKRTPKGTPQRSSQRSANFMNYDSDGPEETPIQRIVVDSSDEDQR